VTLMGKAKHLDADLVRKVLSGNRAAFEDLVDRYWGRVYVLAAHSNLDGAGPEDVVQEAFVQAFRRLATLRQPELFGSWLQRIALHICVRKGRRAGTRTVAPLGQVESGRPPAEAESAEARRLVREAIASLPDHYREVVTLRFFEGMSCEKIARHLAEPVGTVWTRLHRANNILRRKLGYLAPEGNREQL